MSDELRQLTDNVQKLLDNNKHLLSQYKLLNLENQTLKKKMIEYKNNETTLLNDKKKASEQLEQLIKDIADKR